MGNLGGFELVILGAMIGIPIVAVAISLRIGHNGTDRHSDPYADSQVLAGWWQRATAEVIDVSIFVVVVSTLLTFVPTLTSDVGGVIFVVLTILWAAFNWWYLQGTTGQTVGKKISCGSPCTTPDRAIPRVCPGPSADTSPDSSTRSRCTLAYFGRCGTRRTARSPTWSAPLAFTRSRTPTQSVTS